MMRTFNCGIGMIAAVRSADAEIALDTLNRDTQCAQVIGEVIARGAAVSYTHLTLPTSYAV